MQPARRVAASESAIQQAIRFFQSIFVPMVWQFGRRAISISRRRSGLGGQSARGMLLFCARPFFDEIEDRRDKEDSDKAGGQHSADDGGGHDLAGNRAR